MKKVSVLVPCYKRPEYTKLTLESLEENTSYENAEFFLFDDGSKDKTIQYLCNFRKPKRVFSTRDNRGLRDVVIDFFEMTKESFYICKIDNDSLVPPRWIEDLISVYESTDVDILSPNVMPSDAAHRIGTEDGGYFKSRTVGGLWFMERSILDGLFFEKLEYGGIKGAHTIIDQIQIEVDPKIGWTDKVTVQDIGHWSGMHPLHIKSKEHEEYSNEIGRDISWSV